MTLLPFGFLTPFVHRAFLGACVSRMINQGCIKSILVLIVATALFC